MCCAMVLVSWLALAGCNDSLVIVTVFVIISTQLSGCCSHFGQELQLKLIWIKVIVSLRAGLPLIDMEQSL